MLHLRTILVPTDFSPHAEAAFQLANALARDYRAKIVLVHVVSPTTSAFVDGVMLPFPEPDIPGIRDKLSHWHDDSGVILERVVVEGEVLEEILRVADDMGCDMIVMGTHGHGPIRKLLMGGTAQAVVRKAHCPVLTIKPNGHIPAVQPAMASEMALV